MFDQSFTSLSAAQTFFSNDALDLGTFAATANLVVDINLNLVTSTINTASASSSCSARRAATARR